MNFNVGGFSESLKYSYQQFCKQDAEEREHSRRLLVKLKKFEAKSFDLAAQTQVAQQMRNQYERMLMQQNPLLWAQLQRNIATDITDFELEIPLSVRSSAQKYTREKAINTSHHSSTSSEQHSLQEEGIWPHTPSPCPEVGIQQLENKPKNMNICPVPYEEVADNSQAINLSKTFTNLMKEQKSASFHEDSQVKNLQAPTSVQNIHLPQSIPMQHLQLDNFIPASSSTPNIATKQENNPSFSKSPSSSLSERGAKSLNREQQSGNVTVVPIYEEKEVLKPKMVEHHSSYSNETTGLLIADSIVNESQSAVHDIEDIIRVVNTSDEAPTTAQLVTHPQQTNPEVKPFRLDSESECADDPISGPLSGKNAGDDDSDSFWN